MFSVSRGILQRNKGRGTAFLLKIGVPSRESTEALKVIFPKDHARHHLLSYVMYDLGQKSSYDRSKCIHHVEKLGPRLQSNLSSKTPDWKARDRYTQGTCLYVLTASSITKPINLHWEVKEAIKATHGAACDPDELEKLERFVYETAIDIMGKERVCKLLCSLFVYWTTKSKRNARMLQRKTPTAQVTPTKLIVTSFCW